MDSLASVEVPGVGYGIRYEFGIFDQAIRDGWQCEITDKWLKNGNPWEIARSETVYEVKFGGRTEALADEKGGFRVRWVPETVVKGVAYDTPIAGYRVPTCDMLRLCFCIWYRRRFDALLIEPFFAVYIFFLEDLAHGFVVHLAFHPGDNVQVSECPGFKTILFQVLYFLKKIFKLRFKLIPG